VPQTVSQRHSFLLVVRLLIRASNLRSRPQEPEMGAVLLSMRQRPLAHVSASRLKDSLVCASSNEALQVHSGASQAALHLVMARDLSGRSDPFVRNYRDLLDINGCPVNLVEFCLPGPHSQGGEMRSLSLMQRRSLFALILAGSFSSFRTLTPSFVALRVLVGSPALRRPFDQTRPVT
jgi:hypothetical protein